MEARENEKDKWSISEDSSLERKPGTTDLDGEVEFTAWIDGLNRTEENRKCHQLRTLAESDTTTPGFDLWSELLQKRFQSCAGT